jgi:hypothetical protein
MKKVKVSIKDENTLVLLENGSEGDIVDLTSLHDMDADKSTIENVVKSIKMKEFREKVREETAIIEREHVLKLEGIQRENALKLSMKEKEYIEKTKESITIKESRIIELNSEIKNIAEKSERESELQLLKERQRIEKEYQIQLKEKDSELNSIRHEKELNEEKLRDQLKSSETALIHHKEMRTKMSTKMIGESLEIHCENEFNKIRSLAFPRAEFGKDNTISKIGTKGDYIYRESDSN